MMSTMNIGWNPETPDPSGRSAAAVAARTPSMASPLASSSPLMTSLASTMTSIVITIAKTSGASALCASAASEGTNKGQENSARPISETSTSTAVDRPVSRTGAVTAPAAHRRKCRHHFRGGQQRHRGQDLGDLGRERRRRDDPTASVRVQHDLAVGEHHQAAGDLRDQFHVVVAITTAVPAAARWARIRASRVLAV